MMAAYLFHFNPLSNKLFGNTFSQTIGSIRNAFTKSGGSRPKKKSNPKPGRHGVKVADGQIVRACTILVRQRSLQYCPGLNVGVGYIADLYAKVPGKVVFSTEKENLDRDNWLVNYGNPDHLPNFKTYVSVIPEPQHQYFKLVEKYW